MRKLVFFYGVLKMEKVKPKKSLGQHFLQDQDIASEIVQALSQHQGYKQVLEIGPGMGVLTHYLLKLTGITIFVNEIDRESIAYLQREFPALKNNIIPGDFLQLNPEQLFDGPVAIIGNFPYNISSQIFFKILEHKNLVPEVVCMLQKEVAARIASPPGSKVYGILSVLLQAFYNIEYLLSVPPEVFNPPPKVQSAVIRLRRNEVLQLPCNEKLFFRLVKQGFNNRRKTLRNALKPINLPEEMQDMKILNLRAEQLSVNDFIHLSNTAEGFWKQ